MSLTFAQEVQAALREAYASGVRNTWEIHRKMLAEARSDGISLEAFAGVFENAHGMVAEMIDAQFPPKARRSDEKPG